MVKAKTVDADSTPSNSNNDVPRGRPKSGRTWRKERTERLEPLAPGHWPSTFTKQLEHVEFLFTCVLAYSSKGRPRLEQVSHAVG